MNSKAKTNPHPNSNQNNPLDSSPQTLLNKPKIKTTLDRNDEDNHQIDTNKSKLLLDESDKLRNDNSRLEYLLNKYNLILYEYQLKFGNELFAELNAELTPETLDSLTNTSAKSDFKKILLQNFSLFKEYEKNSLENKKSSQFLKNELKRFQYEIERLVKENSELRELFEISKEDQNKLYKTILNKERDKENLNTTEYVLKSTGKSGNNFSDQNLESLNIQIEQLLQLIEKTKFDNDQCNMMLNDYKEKYDSLVISFENLESSSEKILKENENLFQAKKYAEEKLKEYNKKIIAYEKKTNEALQNFSKGEIENKYLKKDLAHYKEMYEEMEKRKNAENEILSAHIYDLRGNTNDYEIKMNRLEEINSDFKFENNKLNSQLNVLRYDCDHMTKIFEESNFAIKAAEEKEKQVDDKIKNCRIRIEEGNLEKDKFLLKQKLLEKQISKISEDYSKNLTEKQTQYENFIENSKEKFNQILDNKECEISNLKSDNLAYKIERDKLHHDYTVMKKEYDKLLEIFRVENEKYIKKFEDSDRSANRISNHLNEKINSLVKKIEKLEYERISFESELNAYKSNEKNYTNLIQKLNKNEEFSAREVSKLKEKFESSRKEKEFLDTELERTTNLYESKLRQSKEQNDLKVTVLENLMKQKKDDFCTSEDKAFDILKKQENITNKYKEEYKNTVTYYENLVENLAKENNELKKQINLDDEDNVSENFNDYQSEEELPEKN